MPFRTVARPPIGQVAYAPTSQPAHRGGSGYNPFADSSLALWLEAGYGLYQERTGAAATTAAAINGDPVGTWRDRRGVIQATAGSDAARPVYRPTGVNGLSGVSLDGTDDGFTLSGAGANAIARNRTYVAAVCAVSIRAEGNESAIFVATVNGGVGYRYAALANNANIARRIRVFGRSSDVGAGSGPAVSLAFADFVPIVLTFIADYGNGDMYVRANGVQLAQDLNSIGSNPSTNSDSQATTVGFYNSALHYDGLISALLVYAPTVAFTADQLLARERYAGKLAGVSF